jgi:hypothetical protein
MWSVTCPGPDGEDYVTGGLGREGHPGEEGGDVEPTHVGFYGPVDAFAAFVGEQSGRPVSVPDRLRGQQIDIDVEGGFDAALRAAGFPDDDGPVIDDRNTLGRPPVGGG